MSASATEMLFLHDAYAESCAATVADVVTDSDTPRPAPDRTTFYPTGGGQLHDGGAISLDSESGGKGDERVRIVVEDA